MPAAPTLSLLRLPGPLRGPCHSLQLKMFSWPTLRWVGRLGLGWRLRHTREKHRICCTLVPDVALLFHSARLDAPRRYPTSSTCSATLPPLCERLRVLDSTPSLMASPLKTTGPRACAFSSLRLTTRLALRTGGWAGRQPAGWLAAAWRQQTMCATRGVGFLRRRPRCRSVSTLHARAPRPCPNADHRIGLAPL